MEALFCLKVREGERSIVKGGMAVINGMAAEAGRQEITSQSPRQEEGSLNWNSGWTIISQSPPPAPYFLHQSSTS